MAIGAEGYVRFSVEARGSVMAKYYVGGQGWETQSPGIGRRYYPNGTLIDDTLQGFAHLQTQGPPVDAIAADQSTYDSMIASQANGGLGYEAWRVQYLAAAGIVPAASTRMPDWY
jgi:hypothetical protein